MKPPARAWLRRWRRLRLQHNRVDPLPLVVTVGNCMSVSTSAPHAIAIFESYLETDADVLLLSECADFDGQRVADAHSPGVWRVIQFGAVGTATSGCAVVFRKARCKAVKAKTLLGSRHTSEGGGIRDRWMTRVLLVIDGGTPNVWRHWFTAGHAPPERAPRARRAFMRRFARVLGTKGGDMNLLARAISRLLGRAVHTIGVLSLAAAAWIPTSKPRKIPKTTLGDPQHHADHHGLAVTLWNTTKENR